MSDIGVIGATYEDRRTKKKGKLIERDEKYKTLLLESSDGKSFNITFGSFKSNWRKVDEPEQTVEEAMEEIPEANIEPEKVEKKPKKEVIEDDEFFESTYDKFVAYAESFNTGKVNISSYSKKKNKNDFICIKLGRNKFIDFYFRARGYFWLMMPEFVYTQTKWSVKLENVVNTPKNRREISCRLEYDDIEKFLSDIRPAIVEVLSGDIKEDK